MEPEKRERPYRGPLWAVVASTVLGLGFTPRMPGTVASAVGLFLFVPVYFVPDPWSWILPSIELGIVCLLAAAAIPHVLRATGQSDPSFIVIDELAGILCALAIAPFEWAWALLAFLLFRILDIFKPFPVDKLEKLPGAWGVMADDLGAGLISGLLVLIVRSLL